MIALLVQAIILILLWFSTWSLCDMFVDSISGDNIQLRATVYLILFILGIFILWIALCVEGLIT